MAPNLKVVVTRRSKDQRQKERHGIKLGDLKPRTIEVYTQAVKAFFRWVALSEDSLPPSLFELDDLIARWIESCWEEGEQLALAANTISGLQHFIRPLRGHLHASWKLIGAWRKKELPAQAPPIPLFVVSALCGAVLEAGLEGLCAGFLLCFHCFLRTAELFDLRCCDIVLGSSGGAVHLPSTKKGIRDAVEISDSLTTLWVRRRLDNCQPGDLFIGCSAPQARHWLKFLLREFGLLDFNYRFYSFRRGGATHFFRRSGSMEATLIKGRWESSRTARIYLAEGALALAQASFSREQKSQLLAFASLFQEATDRAATNA